MHKRIALCLALCHLSLPEYFCFKKDLAHGSNGHLSVREANLHTYMTQITQYTCLTKGAYCEDTGAGVDLKVNTK